MKEDYERWGGAALSVYAGLFACLIDGQYQVLLVVSVPDSRVVVRTPNV